jgi:hypothetical protein
MIATIYVIGRRACDKEEGELLNRSEHPLPKLRTWVTGRILLLIISETAQGDPTVKPAT